MAHSLLSILIPVYNEEKSVRALVERVLAVPLPLEREILLIDDGSTDGSGRILELLAQQDPRVRVFSNPGNRGKGYSVRRGIEEARGDLILIQDADLEYDPQEYPLLLEPLLKGEADVVYGSRFLGKPQGALSLHRFANGFLTALSNWACRLSLTDMETCYKVFKSESVKSLLLEEDRFGIEPELTFKLSRLPKIRFLEVPISYRGRTPEEGKKIGWRDGFRALFVILHYRLLSSLKGEASFRK